MSSVRNIRPVYVSYGTAKLYFRSINEYRIERNETYCFRYGSLPFKDEHSVIGCGVVAMIEQDQNKVIAHDFNPDGGLLP